MLEITVDIKAKGPTASGKSLEIRKIEQILNVLGYESRGGITESNYQECRLVLTRKVVRNERLERG